MLKNASRIYFRPPDLESSSPAAHEFKRRAVTHPRQARLQFVHVETGFQRKLGRGPPGRGLNAQPPGLWDWN
jgi:hypothetical protein